MRAEARRDRLFSHDRAITINATGATFSAWHDRLILALLLLAALAAVRMWFADRSWMVAGWSALVASAIIGAGAGRLVAARLAFHASDGLLAADALHSRTRRRYMVAWHGIGLALLAAVTLTARPSLLIVSLPAYLAGVLLAVLTRRLRVPIRLRGRTHPRWAFQRWSHRPSTGVAAAVILLVPLLPARTLDTSALIASVAVEATLLGFALTTVGYGVIRFMVITGHGSRRIMIHHAKGMASFVAVAVPGCWLLLGAFAAGIVAAASLAMLLLLALRILAYRLQGKRFADLLVSILIGLFMLIAYAASVALPVVVLLMLWQLQRRGRAKTWLLA